MYLCVNIHTQVQCVKRLFGADWHVLCPNAGAGSWTPDLLFTCPFNV